MRSAFLGLCTLLIISCKGQVSEKNVGNDTRPETTVVSRAVPDARSISGEWHYEKTVPENELLNRTFDLRLVFDGSTVRGQYCAIARNGGKIDCRDEEEFNMEGTLKGDTAIVSFKGFFNTKAKGKARLYLYNNQLIWEILESAGEIYAPKQAALDKTGAGTAATPATDAACLAASRYRLPYKEQISINNVVYDTLKCPLNIPGEYKCGEERLRYISLPSKNDIRLILVPQDCGDFPYRFYLLSIRDNTFVAGLYVEGEWQEPEDDNSKEKTTFSIDQQFNIRIRTQKKKGVEERTYTIDPSGKFVQQ